MADHPVPRRDVDVEAVAATSSYRELIERLQRRIRESQARAARALNTELVMLYWSIGHDILAEQQTGGWGEDIVGRIAEDLRVETGSARGFTRRNLFYMRRFAALWPEAEKVPSVMAQISWTAHRKPARPLRRGSRPVRLVRGEGRWEPVVGTPLQGIRRQRLRTIMGPSSGRSWRYRRMSGSVTSHWPRRVPGAITPRSWRDLSVRLAVCGAIRS